MVWLGAKTGDGAAEEFERLYKQWWDDLVALCRRMLGRMADAEDAAQEAFLRAWLARDQYSSSQPYWPWLSTIARRLCVDWQRRGAYASALPETDEVRVVGVTPERVVVATEELQIVFEAIVGLRGRERGALVLREVAGWSYQQIADAQGVTVEAVRGALKRARATVRRSLHDDVFPAGPRRAGGLGADAQELAAPAEAMGKRFVAR